MRESLAFTVVGVEPAPQGSKKIVRGNRMIESSKKVAPFRKAVADAVHAEWVRSGDERSFSRPVIVRAIFFLPRPPSVTIAKRLFPIKPPDLDKLQRALGDGMSVNSHAIEDDSLIIGWETAKVYADWHPVGVQVVVRLATQQDINELMAGKSESYVYNEFL